MPPHGHSRRDALKLLSAGTAAAWLPAPGAVLAIDDRPQAVRYFPLTSVRLGDGPFLTAQQLDAAYLLRLEPDRMLHNFRVNAGLEPRAPLYGGWESVEPWVDIRCHGHTLGHYLTACACMFASTNDTRFADRVDYIVAELAECQKKTGGWLAAFPDGAAPLVKSLAGERFPGVPWYTTHKVLAGLRDAYAIRGSTQARDVLLSFAEWIDRASAGVPVDRFQKMLEREHGGMNEVLADVFALTGDDRYLRLAIRFSHQALLEPLSRRQDVLDGLHSNTQIPKVTGFTRLDELTQLPQYRAAAEFFWETVTRNRSYATGGNGDGEHFFPVTEFARRLGSAKTMETCCTHNMMRLTRALFPGEPRAEYFDYFERALFNGILASQDPDSGMATYFQATRPGYVKLYHTPFDSFWCCTGSGLENHARYGESIYAHRGSTLYVNLFLSSTLDWHERGLTVTQETRFPDDRSTRLTFTMGAPQKLQLALRHPAWCRQMQVSINGRKTISRRPGRYVELSRTFRSGDVVDLQLPMQLHLERLPRAAEYAAVMYGPLVLAGIVGAPVEAGAQLIVNERKSGEMLNEAVRIPDWPRPLDELPAHVSRSDAQRLTFVAAGFDDGPVQFIPWFRVRRERYNLYWRSRA